MVKIRKELLSTTNPESGSLSKRPDNKFEIHFRKGLISFTRAQHILSFCKYHVGTELTKCCILRFISDLVWLM